MKSFYEFSKQVQSEGEQLDELFGSRNLARDKYRTPGMATATHDSLRQAQNRGSYTPPVHQTMRMQAMNPPRPPIPGGPVGAMQKLDTQRFMPSLDASMEGLDQFRQGIRSLWKDLRRENFSAPDRRPNLEQQLTTVGKQSVIMSNFLKSLKQELAEFMSADDSRPGEEPPRPPEPEPPPIQPNTMPQPRPPRPPVAMPRPRPARPPLPPRRAA